MKGSPVRMAWAICVVASCLGMIGCGGGTTRPPGDDGGASSIGTVEVSPQPAFANNSLTALVIPPPGASAGHYRYQWRKNGQPIDGVNAAALPAGLVHKNDAVMVTVTAIDGPYSGASASSRPNTIRNSAPTVTAVGLTPTPIHQQTTVHAVVQGSDVDHDPIGYTYRWYINGEVIPDQIEDTLDGAFVTNGSRIEVEATPSDGAASGDPRRSTEAMVRNSPPRITSQPTTALNDEDTYVYQVAAEDPDGGPVTFSLKSAPEHMSIDPEQGTIRWQVTKQDVGVHPIEIVATNAEGDSIIQQYDLQIYDLQDKAAANPATANPATANPDAATPSHS